MKAIMITDMPRCCDDCALGYEDEYLFEIKCFVKQHKHLEEPDRKRPDWCPLRKLPGTKSEEFGQTIVNSARAEGWNACLEEITEERGLI